MPAWMSHVPWWVIAAAALVLVVTAIAGLRALLARRTPRTATGSGLHSGYLVATVLIAASALALIMVAFTMSYAALYESATWLADTQLTAINGGDLRFLFPLGIDAVIVYFLAMDLVMEWQGRRHPLNRWSAYGLSAITIVLNVAQGEGTTSSYLGHAGPPVVIILIAEGVAAWVRHLAGLAHGGAADRIPAGRWIAHPLSTLKVARLMLGSGITSYPDALEREQQRQLAYAMLREQYARRWRRATPRHLKWMLDNGYDLPTAFRIIRAMTASRVAMTAEEARALLGEPVGPRVPAPAAGGAERPRWRAAAVPEVERAAGGRAGGGRRDANGTAARDGRGAAARRGAARDADAVEGRAPAGAHGERGERGYTPVLFQEPGPVAEPPAGPGPQMPTPVANAAAEGSVSAESEDDRIPEAAERTPAAAAPRAEEPGVAAASPRHPDGPERASAGGPASAASGAATASSALQVTVAEAEPEPGPDPVPPRAPEPDSRPADERRPEPRFEAAPEPALPRESEAGQRPAAAQEPEAAQRPAAAQEPEPPYDPPSGFAAEPDEAAAPEEAPAGPAPRRTTRALSRTSSRERRQQVRQLLESIPDITEEEIAGHLGVTPRTARRYRNEILDTASGSGDYRIEEGEDGQPRLVHTAYGD